MWTESHLYVPECWRDPPFSSESHWVSSLKGIELRWLKYPQLLERVTQWFTSNKPLTGSPEGERLLVTNVHTSHRTGCIGKHACIWKNTHSFNSLRLSSVQELFSLEWKGGEVREITLSRFHILSVLSTWITCYVGGWGRESESLCPSFFFCYHGLRK